MKKTLKILLIVACILIVIRLVLPSIVLHYTNKKLNEMKGYSGHINDVDMTLIRGAYVLDSIYLNEVDSVTKKQTPFFAASSVDLSVEWKALFHGSLVGELVFEKPVLRFTRKKVEPDDVSEDSTEFKDLLDDFMPLRVNRFEVSDGIIQYVDRTSKPPVDVQLSDLYLIAHNLRNSYDSSALLPATVEANAHVYEGELTFNMKLNPLSKVPTFDMNAEVKNSNLVLLNDFFQAYAKVDVNKGSFSMYTETAAKDGAFKGYVKPIIKNLGVIGEEDRGDNIFRKVWEGLTDAAGGVFENRPTDRLATKIPFEGRLDTSNASVGTAIINILQNAFIRAIQPSIDNEITIQSVDVKKKDDRNFFQKLFGSKKDKKGKEKKRDKVDGT
ncbi:MAG TPA: DUF748 domain-containing protein [Cyclobacteriaceae bacterium]|nr:DUF748 domain-containing protein [Cyclobacteriaceae bacterium]